MLLNVYLGQMENNKETQQRGRDSIMRAFGMDSFWWAHVCFTEHDNPTLRIQSISLLLNVEIKFEPHEHLYNYKSLKVTIKEEATDTSDGTE